MSTKIPEELKYTESHEWLKVEAGDVIIGITDFAQSQLGEIVFVELPQAGQEVAAGKECAVIESVKAASDIYAPVSGTITEINSNVEDNTETINDDPYGNGWLFKIKPSNPEEIDAYLSAEHYKKQIDTE